MFRQISHILLSEYVTIRINKCLIKRYQKDTFPLSSSGVPLNFNAS